MTKNKFVPLTAKQIEMIKKRKWLDLGVSEEQAKEIARFAFEDKLSKDVSDTLKAVRKASNESILFFLFAVIAVVVSMFHNVWLTSA